MCLLHTDHIRRSMPSLFRDLFIVMPRTDLITPYRNVSTSIRLCRFWPRFVLFVHAITFRRASLGFPWFGFFIFPNTSSMSQLSLYNLSVIYYVFI